MENDDGYTASTASFSPSFSTYSGDRLVEIAERVTRRVYDEADDEFEFAILQTDLETASSSGDGGLVFPIFDLNLVSKNSVVKSHGEIEDVSPEAVLTPLKDLFLRERNDQSSAQPQTYSSSSDEDEEELEGIPSEIYCQWTPARSTAEMSPSGGCRKSKSTGSSTTSSWSSKRWRIRDLLKRSHSDGKQSLKFLNSSSSNRNYRVSGNESSKNKETVTKKKMEKEKEKEKVSAHEKFYLRNKAMKEEDKRKSYLPYKQDLVGLFTNINRFGRTFPPF